MEKFSDLMKVAQIKWRQDVFKGSRKLGRHNGKFYEHVLPSELWQQNLWEGIRSGSPNSLPAYLDGQRIQRHSGTHNLLSSWIVCANLYFPFRAAPEDLAVVAGFLRDRFGEEVAEVTAIELEYELPHEHLRPGMLLGELDGSRGSGQTSPDVAFIIRTAGGGDGVVLVESKFTEHSFYRCSARSKKGSDKRPANPDSARCLNLTQVLSDPRTTCQQVAWGRRYWEHLRPVLGGPGASMLKCCPAALAGYQLLRQHALAEGAANSGHYDLVVSAVAYDVRNKMLAGSMSSSGIPNIEAWGKIFTGKARFMTFTHQEWVAWVRKKGSSRWRLWLKYIDERYGL